MKVANLVICIWLSITCSLLLVVYNYGLREKWDKFWYKFKPLISLKIFSLFLLIFQIWPTLISICYLRVKELSCKYVRKWKIEVKWSEVNIKPWYVTQASKKLNWRFLLAIFEIESAFFGNKLRAMTTWTSWNFKNSFGYFI